MIWWFLGNCKYQGGCSHNIPFRPFGLARDPQMVCNCKLMTFIRVGVDVVLIVDHLPLANGRSSKHTQMTSRAVIPRSTSVLSPPSRAHLRHPHHHRHHHPLLRLHQHPTHQVSVHPATAPAPLRILYLLHSWRPSRAVVGPSLAILVTPTTETEE